MTHVEHPFPPVADENCRVLILGSFPSVKSREDGFFYGHPQNRFWRMLATILNEPLPTSIEEKKSMLLRHGIALWDVIAACQIEGSSDASVRNAIPVDICKVLDVACVDRVICNGALACKLYQHHLEPITGIKAIALPSTSPANAAWNLGKLVTAWRGALLQ